MAIKKTDKKYVDIKNKKISNSSIMRMFNILQDEDNNYLLNIFKTFDINERTLVNKTSTEDIRVVVPWWEMISHTYYNDINLWWLSCLSNNVVNPFEEIDEGQQISMLRKRYIPYIQRDMEYIFNL
jgi:hypothetical protein